MHLFMRRGVVDVMTPVAVACLVVGCGGGGGGDGGSGSVGNSTASNNAVPGVSVRSTTPPIAASAPVGMTYIPFNVSAMAQGDLSKLVNSTIYVVMSGGGNAIPNPPQVQSITSDGVALLTLQAAAPTTVGITSGTLTFKVCMDAACQSQLSGSPFAVPYTLEAVRPLSAPSSAPPVQTAFGADVTADLPVTLPGYVSTWSVRDLSTNPSASPVVATAASGSDSSTGIVHLRYLPRIPGTYTSKFELDTEVPTDSPFGPAEYFPSQQITVTYTVMPSPGQDLWLSPAAPVFVRTQGDASGGPLQPYVVIAQDGTAVNFYGTQYLSAPAQAQGHLMADFWWNLADGGVVMCDGTGRDCLPSGTYTARDHYQYTKNGSAVDYWVPIDLTIQP